MCNKQYKAPVTWPFIFALLALLSGGVYLVMGAVGEVNERDAECKAAGGEIAKIMINKRQEIKCVKISEVIEIKSL